MKHGKLGEADIHPVDPGQNEQEDEEWDQPPGCSPVAFLQKSGFSSRLFVCHCVILP
jgi:hypothetical protein